MHQPRFSGLSKAFSLTLTVALALVAIPAMAMNPDAMADRVKVETLDNGLTLIVYERATAPVVSFYTHVDVGSAQEVPGITGLAHMFEHMAFKGTSKIGTTDYDAEKLALDQVDRAYYALQTEEQKLAGPDPEVIKQLQKGLLDAQEKANKLVKPNEFTEIIEREGGTGLNAFTNTDTTGYFFSLPANKVELWAYLESERFLDPVFREFYKERDVVQEERRMRTESSPFGRLFEQFQMTAFQAHPYKQPVVGYMSDLKNFTRRDAEAFYKTWYVPSNMTVSVVGNVNAKKIMPMLRQYFGRLPEGPAPPPLRTVEPKGIAEKSVTLYDESQPIYFEGYHRPSASHPDDAIYDAIADILTTGRTSRLHKIMVRDQKIAAQQGAFNGYPGTKYPHLIVFYAVPTPGHSNDEMRDVIRDEIARLKTEPVSDDELKMVKTQAKANLIRGMQSNQGIAIRLATYQSRFGDWRELFHNVDRIDKVTKEDIMRVANATFVAKNRTVGRIETEEPDAGAN